MHSPIQVAEEHQPRDFTQPLTLHSDAINLNVFAFPPLELVDSFLSDVVNWQAASVIAVLPLKATQGFKGNATLLHAYGSHFGIFSAQKRPKNDACPAHELRNGSVQTLRTQAHTYTHSQQFTLYTHESF